jgi:hypothetical protein
MNPDYLKNEGNTLRVQKHQLNNTENKLFEIDNILSTIQAEQNHQNLSLDSMINNMESLLEEVSLSISDDVTNKELCLIENELIISSTIERPIIVEALDQVDFKDNMTWDEYIKSIQEYGFRNNIDLTEDPFEHLMTKSQQVELQKRIKEDFSLKNANCDKYDYMIAGTCGIISGLVDILFVGAPGDSSLGNIADKQAHNITKKFANFIGFDENKIKKDYDEYLISKLQKNNVPLDYEQYLDKRRIQFLEGNFQVNYDQATTNGSNGTGGLVENLSMSNHHLKSLGHSPDIIGLFFSILNQFTNTSSFISNGQIITIDSVTFALKGNNLIAKIFSGITNWFGHIMSDWTGSSGTIGQGGRGTGVPMPFYNLFQMMNFGEFGQHRQTFATITTKVFEEGYDFRHGMAMAAPVVINELLIRFMYTMKAHFYHDKEWADSIPKGSIPELRRMLLVGHGTLCLMDGADAAIRSGGEMVQFLLRTNLLAWTRFGHLALKEVYAWYNSGHVDADAVDQYIDNDLKQMLRAN